MLTPYKILNLVGQRESKLSAQIDRSKQADQIVYLACPYTHAKSEVMEARFEAANRAAAALIKRGHIVYSPITMTHPIDKVMAGSSNTLGSDFWVQFDEAFMRACSSMYVLMIDGWDRSSGIKREIAFFEQSGKPIVYIENDTLLASETPSKKYA